MPISEEPSIIFSYSSVPSMSVNTFSRLFTLRLRRIRVLGGLAGVVDLVKAAARSPWRVRSVLFRLVLPISQFLRWYAREGFIEFSSGTCAVREVVSAFSSSKVASSSDSSMPFFRSGGLLRRYGSGCPGGCHPETALTDNVRLCRGDFLMCCLALLSFAFQRPPQSGNPL